MMRNGDILKIRGCINIRESIIFPIPPMVSTHYIVYATGDSPMGPFTYQGCIMELIIGWTTHHSIIEFGENGICFIMTANIPAGSIIAVR